MIPQPFNSEPAQRVTADPHAHDPVKAGTVTAAHGVGFSGYPLVDFRRLGATADDTSLPYVAVGGTPPAAVNGVVPDYVQAVL